MDIKLKQQQNENVRKLMEEGKDIMNTFVDHVTKNGEKEKQQKLRTTVFPPPARNFT